MNNNGISKSLYRKICDIILAIIVTGLFFFVWYQFVSENNQTGHLLGLGNLVMDVGVYLGLYIVVGRGLKAFRIGIERKAILLSSHCLTLVTVDVIEVFISMAITGQFRFFWQFTWRYCLLFFVQTFIVSILLIVMTNLYRRLFPPLQILEIKGDYDNELSRKMNTVHYNYNVFESLHYQENDSVIKQHINKVDAVLVNDIPSTFQNRLIKYCFETNKRVYLVPKISDIIVKYSENNNLTDTPLCLLRNDGLSLAKRFVKRLFDIVLSGLAFILLSPLFLVVAIIIHLEDGGPVFYKQERCTINEKKFMILKFRSMIVNAEADGKPHPAETNDSRITKIGKLIRACRIDELPQLINILKGDMSIVGPRPERVEHIEKFKEDIPEFSFRTKVKGGLTGYAQVYGKYNTSALDKLKLDLIYITNYSLLLDIQILFETIKILLQKDKTEGFTESKSKELHDAK